MQLAGCLYYFCHTVGNLLGAYGAFDTLSGEEHKLGTKSFSEVLNIEVLLIFARTLKKKRTTLLFQANISDYDQLYFLFFVPSGGLFEC